jgi:hypothetical protein
MAGVAAGVWARPVAAAHRGGAGFRAVGVLLLVIPFLPVATVFGPSADARGLFGPVDWVLGSGIFLTSTWLAGMLAPPRLLGAVRRRGRALAARLRPAALALALAAAGAALVTIAVVVFRCRPVMVDEIVQLFQARIFAAGTVKAPPPALPEFFTTQNLIIDERGWYAQYPPGHSALLALGVWAGAPWLVPILFSLGTIGVAVACARRIYGDAVAAVTAALFVLSPFFLFMGASFMNHAPTLFFVSLALLALVRWEETHGARWPLLWGAAVGAAFLCRPVCAFATGGAMACFALPEVVRRRRWGHAALAAAGLGALASPLLGFNWATTGNPFLPGYIKLWGASHGLGFHESPWGERHTPWTGLGDQLLNLSMLNEYLFESPIPGLAAIGAFFALGLGERRWDRRLLLLFLSLPAAYFFYWHRDSYLGPRFLHTGLLFLLPLTARALAGLHAAARRRRLQFGDFGRPVRLVDGLTILLAASIGYSLVVGMPSRFRIYQTGVPSMKVDLLAKARAQGLRSGLVFVAVAWGNRLINGLRAAGLSASATEKAYRQTDHCVLEELLRQARAEGWSGTRLEERVRRAAAPTPLPVVPVNGDQTLRLAPGSTLTPACADEIAYDRQRFTLFVPHLNVNRPTLDGPWVVATDLRERNAALRARYPGLPAYLYRGDRFVPLE